MPFSEEDKVLIKNLNLYKGYGPRRLMTEFLEKNWKKGGLEKLSQKAAGNRMHQPTVWDRQTAARAH